MAEGQAAHAAKGDVYAGSSLAAYVLQARCAVLCRESVCQCSVVAVVVGVALSHLCRATGRGVLGLFATSQA